MEEEIQIYVDIDEEGNVITAQTGKYIIPSKDWDHFFLRDKEIAENIYDYKVVISELKADLVPA